jgi:hypothetical protein
MFPATYWTGSYWPSAFWGGQADSLLTPPDILAALRQWWTSQGLDDPAVAGLLHASQPTRTLEPPFAVSRILADTFAWRPARQRAYEAVLGIFVVGRGETDALARAARAAEAVAASGGTLMAWSTGTPYSFLVLGSGLDRETLVDAANRPIVTGRLDVRVRYQKVVAA